ncbi:MAG: hypothetical protein ACK56I_11065, partial [bacterium]
SQLFPCSHDRLHFISNVCLFPCFLILPQSILTAVCVVHFSFAHFGRGYRGFVSSSRIGPSSSL